MPYTTTPASSIKTLGYRTPSPPPSPPAGVSMTGHLTELARPQAEAKAQAYTQQVLRDHIQDQAGFDNRLDRCIALTESLLAETRNFLGEPEKEKLPAQLLSPVEYTETHASAGLKLARLTVEAAMADTQRVYESVDRLLTLREARRTALLPTSPPIHFPRLDAGSFGESAIATGNKSTDAGGEEELEFASAGATGGSTTTITEQEAELPTQLEWQRVADFEVEMHW